MEPEDATRNRGGITSVFCDVFAARPLRAAARACFAQACGTLPRSGLQRPGATLPARPAGRGRTG